MDYRKARKFVRSWKNQVLERNVYAPWYSWPWDYEYYDAWVAQQNERDKELVRMSDEYWEERTKELPYEVFVPYKDDWNCDEVTDWLQEYAGFKWASYVISCDEYSHSKREEWFKSNREGTIFRFADKSIGLMFKVAWG